MNSANSSEEQLLELLRQCTVKLIVTNGHGTGFFVAPDTILTCAHVVIANWRDNKAVEVDWNGQSFSASILYYLPELDTGLTVQSPDLALLKVDDKNIIDHPCVYLHPEAHLDDKMCSYGYTNKYPTGDPSTYVNEGWSDEQHLLLKLKEGQAQSGLSGAPVLNRRTGGVCGIMKRSRDIESDLGGRAIPTQIVFQALLEQQIDLRDIQQKFHAQDNRWYACLTQQQRETVGLLPAEPGLKVFFLYSDNEADQKWLLKLETHLATLRNKKLITTWYKGKMEGGADEKQVLREQLNSADIILLLVSPDFINSHDRKGAEVEEALKRREAGARVIPVLIRASHWRNSSFGHLRPLPLNGKPIKQWTDDDEAFLEVTEGIYQVVMKLQK